jgi:hydroxymethylglutaryl-CoA synthase
MTTGIIGYAGYVPRPRITSKEYIQAIGMFTARNIQEKAIPSFDEDSISMAIQAASDALKRGNNKPEEISGLFFASTTPPYTEKASSSTIAAALDLYSKIQISDFGFSTKAGGDALLACIDYVSSGRGKNGLVIASDSPKANVSDTIEHGLGAGASAFIISNENVSITFEGSYAETEEILGERFRRDGKEFIEDVSIAPYTQGAFHRIVKKSVQGLMSEIGINPDEVAYIVLHQNNIRASINVAKSCGFPDEKVSPGILSSSIGDAGASSTLLGFVKVLDQAKTGDRILVNFYGSGSGSNTLSFIIDDEINTNGHEANLLEQYLSDKEYVDYLSYLKLRRRI